MTDNHYSIKELEKYIKNKFPEVNANPMTIYMAIRDNYPQYLCDKNGKRTYMNKKGKITYMNKNIIEKIDFNYINILKSVSGEKTTKQTIDLFLGNGYLPSIASRLLGFELERMKKFLNEGKFFKYTNETSRLVNRDEVDYWINFKKNYIGLRNIYTNIKDKIGEKYNLSDRAKYNLFFDMRNSGILNKFNVIDVNDTCFLGEFGFVKKEIEDEIINFILKYLENVIVNKYGSKIDILELYIKNNSYNKNIKETLKYLSLYGIDKISKTRSITPTRFNLIINEIVKLDKELFNCNDDEVSKILLKLTTKASKEEYCRFLMYLKEVINTKYSKNYQYDREATLSKKSNINPYSMDQYLRFGFLCLSDGHIWYEEYMNKALSSRRYSSVWLYCVFHYICAWRKKDIQERIPHINLGMKPNELLEKIKNKELDDKIAIDYVNQIKFELDMLNIKPQKTQSKTTPNLVLEIPESIKIHVGTLLGIVQAQYELSNNHQKKGLIIENAAKKINQQDFFGEEYKNIFKNESFSNLRAVKNYELLTIKNGDEQSVGTGYVLASIARSHKFFGDKKSETTKIYLEHFYKLEDSEKILIELYERGVCSFVPYLLTKAIYGKENVINLDIEQQTLLIKDTIGYDNYDTEIIIQMYDKVSQKSKETISKIISEYKNGDFDEKKEIEKILKNIAYNNAPSKNDNVGCIAVAQGKGCLYPYRDVCFGCGYEIYLKSYLSELGKYINNIKKAAYQSKTEGSKRKNVMMIKDVLVPLTEEIFITLKTIYNINDLTEYKNLLK